KLKRLDMPAIKLQQAPGLARRIKQLLCIPAVDHLVMAAVDQHQRYRTDIADTVDGVVATGHRQRDGILEWPQQPALACNIPGHQGVATEPRVQNHAVQQLAPARITADHVRAKARPQTLSQHKYRKI